MHHCAKTNSCAHARADIIYSLNGGKNVQKYQKADTQGETNKTYPSNVENLNHNRSLKVSALIYP